MPARQREVGAAVIKVSIIPVTRVMAGCTICAELTVVFVILLMASKAIGRRALEHIVHVTAFATHFPMSAVQLEGG